MGWDDDDGSDGSGAEEDVKNNSGAAATTPERRPRTGARARRQLREYLDGQNRDAAEIRRFARHASRAAGVPRRAGKAERRTKANKRLAVDCDDLAAASFACDVCTTPRADSSNSSGPPPLGGPEDLAENADCVVESSFARSGINKPRGGELELKTRPRRKGAMHLVLRLAGVSLENGS